MLNLLVKSKLVTLIEFRGFSWRRIPCQKQEGSTRWFVDLDTERNRAVRCFTLV